MNKIFKVIYSKVRNCYVVTSEFAKANTKSSTGSAKQTAKKSLLSLAIAMGIAGGGFVNVGAAEKVDVQTTGGSTVMVYTKYGTESYVESAVESKLQHKLKFYYTATEVDQKLDALSTGATTNKDNITTLDSKTAGLSADGKSLSGMTTVSGTNVETGALTVTGEIKNGAGVTTTLADINDSMKKTTRIDYDAANDTTSVNGMKVGQQVDMGGKNLTDVGTINGIKLGTNESGNYISQDGSILGNMKNVDTQVGKNAVAIGENTTAITALDTKVGEIDDRTGGIKRNTEDTQTTIEGKVTVDNSGNVGGVKDLSAETIETTGNAAIGGKLGVTGETTLNDKLTAKGEATFKENVTAEKDLTVNGKLNVGEIYLENNKLEAATGKKHDSATAITADGISNLAKVTDHGHTTESQFTHNEKGTVNYAKDGNTTDWTETRSDVTADGVTTEAKDSKENRTNTSQTADGIKGYATDKDGNKTYTKVTATENSFQIQDKDGKNKNHQVNTKDSSVTEITNKEGKTTKTEQTATDITNTAKDGTITNDAQTIVNNTTGDMTNTVGGKLTTTVTGQATENFNGGLDTNVTGTENHIVTGAQNIHVTENQTNTIDGNQVNTIGGDQITNVTGDISNKAKNITNEANTKLTDKVGDNTRVLDSEGITDTVPGAGGKGSTFKQRIDAIMGNVKTDAGESEVTQKGDEITSVVGKGEATISRVTQKKGSLEAVVTDGTSFNHSRDIANASSKTLTGYNKMNQLLDDLNSSTKTITDGTHKTSKVQTALDITNTAADGTITNDAKNIVNNASGDMTNTVGGKLTTTVTGATEENYNGGLTTNVTGEENHTVTGKQNNKVTGKQTNTVEGGQENIISGGQTNTITGGQINNITGDQTTTITGNKTETVTENVTEDYKKNLTTTVGGNEIHEVKGTKTETVEGKVIENFKGGQETNVTGNQDIHVTGKQTNKIDGNQENTIGGDQITNVTGDISNKAKNITNEANTKLTDKVGDNTRVINSRSITDTVGAANRMIEDGKITDNAGDSTVTTEKDKGTTFTKRGSMAYRDGGSTDTNISGNTITTGKVTMDYAEVMKDLGVHGNATVDNDLTVEGTTTTKTLNVTEDARVDRDLAVGGNATITGDVTANSYKVGRNTYIDANGINANNQKITNVADGSISEGSKDAVNGGQLFETNRRIDQFDSRINEVGANAAAMANLHPMEFDADSKLNVAVGVGNYRNKTATAMGLFYRPNEDVMFNVSSTIGSSDNMIGGGVSFRLGSGGNKLKNKAFADAAEQNKQLKSQVDTLQAQMDALLSVINPNMSKDFPDVPDNHWAYEAVSRLAGNDIIQGYEDGKYHGERTMTRYEMAVIIYKALQKGIKAEAKLVEEFKPELKAIAAHEKA